MEQENGIRLGELLQRAYIAVKKRIILVLAVIFILTAGGAVIAYIRKPMYTASERVSYKAADNMTDQYFQTVVGFCNKGCVIDRANFYYDYYLNSGKKYNKVEDFLQDIAYIEYDASKTTGRYISAESVSVSASSPNSTQKSYIFTVKYKDADANAARDKVLILIQALGDEVSVKNGEAGKYFGVTISINDLGLDSILSDWSKAKIVFIAFIVGVVAAFFSVYVINIADSTVKEKGEIERLTGVDLLAFIDDQGA